MTAPAIPRRMGCVFSCFFLIGLASLSQPVTAAGYATKGISGSSLSPSLTTTIVRPPKTVTSTSPPPVIFTKENNTELVAQIGTTVVLHCAAENVGENTVSWIRRRDYHLLTVGTTAYSSDQRFQVRFLEDKNDWQLHIRYVQKHDEGEYECQVSSYPPVSLIAKLNVVEASSEILGGPEKFLRTGSSLRLVCVLRKNTQPPSYVFWYLNDRMINYDQMVKVDTSGELSVLFLSNVGPESSGNYTCVPSNAKSSTIHIQVLRGGEMPAAIHSGSQSSKNYLIRFEALVLVLFLSHFVCSSTCEFIIAFVAIVDILPLLLILLSSFESVNLVLGCSLGVTLVYSGRWLTLSDSFLLERESLFES